MKLIKRLTQCRNIFKLSKISNENTPKADIPDHSNPSINMDKQAIFIAVPKTGTTSIRTQFRPKGSFLVKNVHLNICQVRDSIYVYLLMQQLSTNFSFPNTHALSDTEIRHKAHLIFTSFFKFASVRNPWARAVSLYKRREGVKMSNDISFNEFIEQHIYASDTCRQPTLHKNQYDWLCDEEGKFLMDYVYKLENFDTAIKEIAEITNNRVKLMSLQKNVNPVSSSVVYRDVYNDRTKNMIAKRFEKDIDYFKFTF